MKKNLFFVLAVFSLAFLCCAAYADDVKQENSEKAYFVKSNGKDTNDGRSIEAPLKTIEKAVEMASKGVIKKIIVIGKIQANNRDGIIIDTNGSSQILITGIKDSPAKFTTAPDFFGKAKQDSDIGRVISIRGNSKIVFEHVHITGGNVLNGGGLYIDDGGDVVIGEGVKIYKNTAYNGGGIYVSNKAFCTIVSGEIYNNKAGTGITSGFGGGIYGNVLITGNAVISNNTVQGFGGGVSGNVKVTGNAIIKNNKADSYGGGIHGEGSGSVEIADNAIISNNEAKKGGGVYTHKLAMSGNSVIKDNIAYEEAGGVYAENIIDMTDNSTVIGNRSSMGGGIAAYSLTMSGSSQITENSAEGDCGGGLFVIKPYPSGKGAVVTMSDNAKITKNSARNNGGGGFVALTMNGHSEISDNTAKKNAGGVFAVKLDIKDSAVIKNNSAEYGGGVYIYKEGDITVFDGKITANKAKFVGGGIYLENGAKYTKFAGNVSENIAGDGDGHDIFQQQ
ncbi:MAG: right-handed parallel beta-helix repeat-containing protein [Endomicrobia bacterium]|nr:right-handed parallel beta-helix repeat-containing protein [Endomicrobiia bacterium]